MDKLTMSRQGAELPFGSLYRHGFARVAVGVPKVRVVDPEANVEATLTLARLANEHHALLAVFPELGLSSYTAEDLFHQEALLDAAHAALARLLDASSELGCVLVVGAPTAGGRPDV